MNWSSLFLTLLLGIIVKVVSSSSDDSDEKTLILKAVVSNLPDVCKKLNAIGSFNALSKNSYDCLFEEEFQAKKASTVMVLLMQRGDEKLVEEIAKKWVIMRKWGPFDQEGIASDLMVVLSIKSTVHASKKEKEKKKFELNSVSVYGAFKTLLKSGTEFIAANEIYAKVAAEVFNLAFKADKEENDYTATASIILDHFYSINETISTSGGDGRFENSKRAQAAFTVSSLNHLVKSKKIKSEAWDVYGPLICKRLNSIFGTDFVMVEKSTEKEDSSSCSSSTSDENVETAEKGAATAKVTANPDKVFKLIELKIKPASSKTLNTSLVNSKNATNSTELDRDSLLIVGGSSVLLLASVFCVYQFFYKRRKVTMKSNDV
jgi:hypothetical protein